jgi:hypothetical protein
MGRSTTPTYAVYMHVPGFHYTPEAWPTKHYGRPTAAALAKFVEDFERSTQDGGCNQHLGVQRVARAHVARQSTGATVASYAEGWAPMFQVIA